MRRRAFTLIECVIVMTITLICLVPVGLMFDNSYKSFTALSMQAQLKSQCQLASESVFSQMARRPGFRVDADRHGVSWSDGGRVRLEQGRLEMRQHGRTKNLLPGVNLLDFTVVQKGAVVTLNLQVESKAQPHGKPVKMHEIYDFPRVGLP